MSHYLSKSRVLKGLQCHRYLWWYVHEPDAEELVPDAAQQAVFDRGISVGEVARDHVPGGVLIERDERGSRGALEDTQAALDRGERIVYEASFSGDRVFAAVDVLEQGEAGWNLIEVKSSTQVHDVYVTDVAVQMHVLDAAGIPVQRGEVMVLNRQCVYPDLGNLFVRNDVTQEATEKLADLPARIAAQRAMLDGELPEVEVGDHCNDPYPCPFMARCWPERPPHHVTTLYYGGKKAKALAEAGCETVLDIPDDVALNAVQRRQIRAVREGALICEDGLAEALEALPSPVGYLDFETIRLLVPRWDGCRPFDQTPAQFVCYVRDEAGEPQLREWLAEGGVDPRPACAREVVEACRGAAVLVAWNAGFEKRCLQGLAAAVPDLAEELLDVAARLADLHPIVKDHVYHPDFGGKFKLKVVLPVLVPELSYADLEIQDGDEASRVLEGLVCNADSVAPEERERLREALKAYCRLDVWGLVKLHETLIELAGNAP